MPDDFSSFKPAPDDYSSFKPAQDDFSGFKPVQPTQKSNVTAPSPGDDWRTMQGKGILASGQSANAAYESASLNGFGGLVARHLIGDLGLPVVNGKSIDENLRDKFPGQTDDWYKSAKKTFINQGVIQARQQAAEAAKGGNPITNFAAGVAGSADPSWLVPVGKLAQGAKFIPKVATSVAGHAALASADDAAYQGADIAEGIQKGFDIKRNLENAAFGGAFGGVVGVSPYVVGLFKARGMDTKPADIPAGTATPLSGQPMDPASQAQYHELLQSGSVEDIKKFFNGRNGPQPSWDQVHQWVKYRDAVPEGFAQDEFKPEFNLEAEIQKQGVRDQIAQTTQNWKNAPDINVVHSTDADLHPDLQNPETLGMYGSDGRVHIVADRIDSPELLHSVLYHEALGHYGLAQQFGDRLDTTIKTLLDRNVGGFKKDVDAWVKNNPTAYNGDRIRAAEEVLAEQSQNGGPIKPSVMDALTAHVRNFGRKMGLDLSYSDREIRTILGMAHQAVINGKPSAAANGFHGGNRYMYAGVGAKDAQYRQYFKAPDDSYRTEIDDSKAKLIDGRPDLPRTARRYLDDVLHHPELYEAYPHLRDIEVESDYNLGKGIAGSYNDKEQLIKVNPNTKQDKLAVILHEVQHAIQEHEGHAIGGGDELSDHDYLRTFGEVEARDTAHRRQLNAGDRAETPPYSSYEPPAEGYRFDYADNYKNAADRLSRGSDLHKALSELNDEDFEKVRGKILDRYDHQIEFNHNLAGITADLVNSEPFKHYVKFRDLASLEKIRDYVEDEGIYGEPHDRIGMAILDEGRGQHGRLSEIADNFKKRADALTLRKWSAENAEHPSDLAEHYDNEWDLPNDLKDIGKNPDQNRFMQRSQITPRGVAQETFDDLEHDYRPTSRSWDEAEAAAIKAGLDPESIKKAKNVGELDKKAFMYDQVAQKLNARLVELAEKKDTPEGLTHEEAAEAIEHVANLQYARARIDNLSSEVGRALNAMKQVQFSRNNLLKLKEALGDDPLSGLTDPDNLNKFLTLYNKLLKTGNKTGAANVVKQLRNPNWEDYVLTFRNEMMLSAPSTHIKAPMDMMTNAIVNVENKIMAMPLGVLRQVAQHIPGLNVKQGVTPHEVFAHVTGLIKASLEWKTWKDAADAFEQGTSNTSQVQGLPKIPDIKAGPVTIPTGLLNIPTKAIAFQDSALRSIIGNAELHSLGIRDAYAKLGKNATWDDVSSHADSAALNPTKEMLAEAQDNTNRTILMNQNIVTTAMNRGLNYLAQQGAGGRALAFAGRALTAFSRVGINAFMSQIVRRSPLALLDGYTIGELKAGGARSDIALTKIVLGSTLMSMYWMGYKKILGDQYTPNSPAKRDAMEAGGYRPNAVKEDSQYQTGTRLNLSINPADHHNRIALMVAEMHKAYDEGADNHNLANGLKIAMSALVHEFSQSTAVNNLAPVSDALTADNKTMGQKFTQLAGDEAKTFMPNVTNQLAKVIDPNQHDTRGNIAQSVQANIPFASKSLPVRQSVYGEPMPTGTTLEGIHVNKFLPGNHVNEVTDPTEKEISRIENAFKETVVGPVQRTIKVNGQSKKLTNEEFENYQHYVGVNLVASVRDAMSSPQWAKMSDEDKAVFIHEENNSIKKQVREALYGQ